MDYGSVSQWIVRVRDGEEAAAADLWNHYHQRLLAVARGKLKGLPTGGDEEDVVVDALASFFQRARDGRFPDLNDRHGLWKLLVAMTQRKAANKIAFETRQKRGGGRVQSLDASTAGLDPAGGEPAPEMAVVMAESLDRLLMSLDDDEQREIALGKLNGDSNEMIARRINRSVPTVERRLRLIRLRLQEVIDDESSTG